MINVAVLGSTGSVGRQVLQVADSFKDKVRIVALAAGSNVDLLLSQIKDLEPKVVYSVQPIPEPIDCVLAATMEEIAVIPEIDMLVVATSGRNGLLPILAALKAGKKVALANKEALVMAGEIIIKSTLHEKQIIPVDSEHVAIWQCLDGEVTGIERIYLTASGGPFYNLSTEKLQSVTPEQALNHPVWNMGKKITIDSANLMNKGLEIIEAKWLYGVPIEQIEVLIHPEGIVHSLVEFVDGSMKAQLGYPDMRIPIQYAMSYPERWFNSTLPRLDLLKFNRASFLPVDKARFPCLELAIEAGIRGGTYPAVLCGADEIAVDLFLNRQVGFVDIPRIITVVLEKHQNELNPSLEQIIGADEWSRRTALDYYKKRIL